MSKGFTGKILRVNLNDEKITVEKQDELFYRRYFGGEGIVAYYLLKELEPGTEPFAADNLLIFACGPITGVPFSGASRSCVGGKSPLTNGFGEAEVGGFWGAELKKAGYDAIIIKGQAKKPSYLSIFDGEVKINSAEHLWGKDTGEVQKQLQEELADKRIRIASIGKAGENKVLYANIMHDLRHAAGRTGMGAIMGAKNLKAVVVRGKGKVKVDNNEKLTELRKYMTSIYLERLEHFSMLGTGGDRLEQLVREGNLPVHNFRDGEFPEVKNIDPRVMKEELGMKMDGCYACPIRCKKVVGFDQPYSVEEIYGAPEYESIGAFGSICGISDVKTVIKANELCNRYSLDTISTGVTIAFAMECCEKGLLSKDQTEGLELHFGNGGVLLQLIEKIANKEGIGKLLALGTKRMAEEIGQESADFAINVKGLEVPMHEPRLKKGLGLGYAVSPTGADHMHNLNDYYIANQKALGRVEPFGIIESVPLNDLSAEKVRAVIYQTNWRVAYNCMCMCMFQPWNHQQIVNIVSAVTGWQTSLFELLKLGERVTNMARLFNLREGFTKDDDWLPKRFFQPTRGGALSSISVTKKELTKARKIYYRMMNWDKEGIPTKEKLQELEISGITG